MQVLDTDSEISTWIDQISMGKRSDYVFLYKNDDAFIWFATNYKNYLSVEGNCEIVTVFGELVNDLSSFIYQINLSLVSGYRAKPDYHVLYDLLLNFETEPEKRFIFWYDTHVMFHDNPNSFQEVFESMVISAYCNRNGISTFKSDGERYRVDQRNFFFLKEEFYFHFEKLLHKSYYIPSIDSQDGLNKVIDFNVIKLT